MNWKDRVEIVYLMEVITFVLKRLSRFRLAGQQGSEFDSEVEKFWCRRSDSNRHEE